MSNSIADRLAVVEDTILVLQRALFGEVKKKKHQKRSPSPSPPPPSPVRRRAAYSPQKRRRQTPPPVEYSDTDIYIKNWPAGLMGDQVRIWLGQRYGEDNIRSVYAHPTNKWGKLSLTSNACQNSILEERDLLATEFGFDSFNIVRSTKFH
jgi:hypothetical protein